MIGKGGETHWCQLKLNSFYHLVSSIQSLLGSWSLLNMRSHAEHGSEVEQDFYVKLTPMGGTPLQPFG
ncbi:MAG: hypothetical protein HC903_16020 [Methylacidiphilales bacterium]|nr:hypothetical protein [Candidatus Methylacidiphilales bacterium]NJR19706.1 hypothetical protein [Calothrix sp. CSU_2_0]